MIDKNIHKYDFKFRALLTNQCNFNCEFCLNDFQDKNLSKYLDLDIFYNYLKDYVELSKRYEFEPQVYLSGGEPTIHQKIADFIQVKKLDPQIKLILCSNGSFSDSLNKTINQNVDEVHLSIYSNNQEIIFNKLENLRNAKIQCVFSNNNNYVNIDLIKKLKTYNIPIKVFANFFDNDYTQYYKFQKLCDKEFGENQIAFRHTGKQENRGIGCNNCNSKCITLKGAWLFPDGIITPCPQHRLEYSLKECYDFHKISAKF